MHSSARRSCNRAQAIERICKVAGVPRTIPWVNDARVHPEDKGAKDAQFYLGGAGPPPPQNKTKTLRHMDCGNEEPGVWHKQLAPNRPIVASLCSVCCRGSTLVDCHRPCALCGS